MVCFIGFIVGLVWCIYWFVFLFPYRLIEVFFDYLIDLGVPWLSYYSVSDSDSDWVCVSVYGLKLDCIYVFICFFLIW